LTFSPLERYIGHTERRFFMTTLENLYYVNINPANKYIKRESEYSKLINLSARNEEKLKYNYLKQTKTPMKLETSI